MQVGSLVRIKDRYSEYTRLTGTVVQILPKVLVELSWDGVTEPFTLGQIQEVTKAQVIECGDTVKLSQTTGVIQSLTGIYHATILTNEGTSMNCDIRDLKLWAKGTGTANTSKEGNSTMIKQQVAQNKEAVKVAARITAGNAINKKVLETIKPHLPLMVRGYADSPLAEIVIANAFGMAMKQYAPANKKLQLVADCVLEAAVLKTIDNFDIPAMIEGVLDGVSLPGAEEYETTKKNK